MRVGCEGAGGLWVLDDLQASWGHPRGLVCVNWDACWLVVRGLEAVWVLDDLQAPATAATPSLFLVLTLSQL